VYPIEKVTREIHLSFVLPPGMRGFSLARVVSKACSLDEASAQELIAAGAVRLGTKVGTTHDFLVTPGERVDIHWNPQAASALAQASIVFHDDDMAVFSKPAGIPVLSTPMGSGTTLEAFAQTSFPGRAIHFVHRIDLPVSGLVLAALNGKTAKALARMFDSSEIRKVYLAAVRPSSEGRALLARASRESVEIASPLKWLAGKRRAVIDPNGAPAVTLLRTAFGYAQDVNLVAARIITGRTHQIRAHLGSVGLPICGDALYGSLPGQTTSVHALKPAPMKRISLHATLLSLPHPTTREPLRFVLPPPPDFFLPAAITPLENAKWRSCVEVLDALCASEER